MLVYIKKDKAGVLLSTMHSDMMMADNKQKARDDLVLQQA